MKPKPQLLFQFFLFFKKLNIQNKILTQVIKITIAKSKPILQK